MSGHSKWANIKNRKGAQDKRRSEAFTKAAKDILTAIRLGGGNTNSQANLHLKTAIDKARSVNMPKENIERLIARFEERKANLSAMMLEGYGPGGVPILMSVETDNRNRTLGEIKLIFRNYGVSLGEANSVAFLFERVGQIEVGGITGDEELKLIDMGVIDLGEEYVYTKPEEMVELQERIIETGMKVEGAEIVMRCKQPVVLESEETLAKVLDLIEELEEHDDVVNVFSGFDYHGQEN